MSGREVFARAALEQIPKLLTLQDRNPHSPTYGCFDRNFWHYKIIDFPSGMAQEFVWPLALAWALDLPDNPYYRSPTVREWVQAGILYAARSSHSDGSCDDYYPFERAMGAAAFSLLACAEASTLIDMQSKEAEAFLQRRADWLADREESGRLSNHHALTALCMEVVGRLLRTGQYEAPRDRRLEQLLSWQTNEGWFPEYEGCDPGYHTLTVSCLARLHEWNPDARLEKALRSAIALAAEFVHPDGSFGGEYTSRNTYNFFPHGFELAGRWLPDALAVNDRIAGGLAADRGPCYADDHIIGHHTWNYLLAARDWVSDRPPPPARPEGRVHLQKARILIDRRADAELYVGLNKGGSFKLFRSGRLALSDTGVSLRVTSGAKRKTAVAHLVDDYECEVQPDRITVRGQMGWAKQKGMTPFNLIVLRMVSLTIGRFAPDLVRSLLQKVLITGKKPAPFTFTRELAWDGAAWKITDRVEAEDWSKVAAAGIGPDQTSIYVVMSRTFQAGQLQGWLDLTPQLRALPAGQPLVVERQA